MKAINQKQVWTTEVSASIQGTKSQNQTGIFVAEDYNGTNVENVRCWRELEIKDGRQKPEVEMKNNAISQHL